ncbi:hypothetical protein CJ030_MR1G014055 [Morella rubra]|uniref:Uncharacterized protein n=1 Tax=Morella rubra TaxID=262757 RepID=A0A6A1WP72_9ROSI|nr:hypothetical protein CJ030_MR1G014055 [Morella rubra]
MSSSRSKRPAHQMSSSVSSRTQKKGRNTEEPTPTPEARIYRSGLSSMDEIKDKHKKLGKSMEELFTCMQTGFEDIKKIHGTHTERFGTLAKDVRQLKLQVNNSIHVASNVIQDTVNEFKATSTELQTFVQKSSEDVVQATEMQMDSDRNLRPHVSKWTY